MAGALAKGLGLAPERIAKVLYRAPSVLVDDLEPALAESLASLLHDAGLVVTVEDATLPPPPAPELFDLALLPLDVTHLPEIAERLAAFLGTDSRHALELILTPPGLILGQVSGVTAERLEAELLTLPVRVVRSLRSEARYCLADAGLPEPQRQQLLRVCEPVPAGVAGVLATNLTADSAGSLVRQHAARSRLPIIDQVFTQFEIELLEAPATDAAAEQLVALSDVPPRVAGRVLAALPVVIADNVSWSELADRLDALAQHGFRARARLTTLDQFRLRRIQAPSEVDLPGLLERLGICDAASVPGGGPVDANGSFPALQAQLLSRSLRGAGCAVELEREVA
ncbi:hypothetical protein M0534_03300 [Methylonatrum kenyense]|uniref:hypothetical protein n=1 Tax=Methylonatrum kenyense TaxID=455253 RepID=UPI0020BF1C13|nr:hypothetical protein [Methylonatrum kenyense]MCK8515362.1 hypothetical protein [Methylonatrum kenyense]